MAPSSSSDPEHWRASENRYLISCLQQPQPLDDEHGVWDHAPEHAEEGVNWEALSGYFPHRTAWAIQQHWQFWAQTYAQILAERYRVPAPRLRLLTRHLTRQGQVQIQLDPCIDTTELLALMNARSPKDHSSPSSPKRVRKSKRPRTSSAAVSSSQRMTTQSTSKRSKSGRSSSTKRTPRPSTTQPNPSRPAPLKPVRTTVSPSPRQPAPTTTKTSRTTRTKQKTTTTNKKTTTTVVRRRRFQRKVRPPGSQEQQRVK
mmetsp:Transcript_14298/g.29647  ORF Transcript_14298/g.29647 Transcript_14298/m.29647 type:complete len:258 (-) Transcript_14298:167-940(-)